MQTDLFQSLLNSTAEAEQWFRSLGVGDPRAAASNLQELAQIGLPADLLGLICEQFAETAPRLADADMALNNLSRFLQTVRSPLSTAALFERDPEALPQLLLLLSCSQSLSDQLCVDPEGYDSLRMSEGRAVAREVLVDELLAEVRVLRTEAEVLAALRRFKRRETLRIAYGDIVQDQTIPQTTRQISYVADAVVEAALGFALRQQAGKSSSGNGRGPSQPQLVVLALGKLGGLELNYSSDIDLVLLFHSDEGAGRELETQAFVNRVSQSLIRLLSESTDLGFAYRVDMRLRPDGRHGPLCVSKASALAYYDRRGRTWERQAYVKARPIAGDLQLGQQFLDALEPWIYRRYLSLADITGIKALKRKIEDRATDRGLSERDAKTGYGGIRDIEFVIQFLQLLNGGSQPSIRTGNTLDAIALLEQSGCLTHQERAMLEENYCFLRKLEHRLQIMFDLQTHQLPADEPSLVRLALRMGYVGTPHVPVLDAFQADYGRRTDQNRTMLQHLLHDVFGDDAQSEPEVDLINDPDPESATIERVLGRYPFRNPAAAYEQLMSLAEERIPFLSTRRCRLFLASIAPQLLEEIARTPDPDATLVSLSRVSASLGGKAALWELFSSNRPSMNLYVTLCAACPYLASILTSNPGMIDELTDSLLVEGLPSKSDLVDSLEELTRGAEDLEPILHSFKHAQHLRVGVRDILGKDDIEATHAALSDVAEVCLRRVIEEQTQQLENKLGQPLVGEPSEDRDDAQPAPWRVGAESVGQPCEFIVLALGKLGGREPNYHSDLDLVFLYEADGDTQAGRNTKNGSTSNGHFFSQLGQQIMKVANHIGPFGQLYEVDPRLRPTGRSGQLAVPLEKFVRYFQQGDGQLWERQALCKARVLLGSPAAAERAKAAIAAAIFCRPWQAADATEIREMRLKLQQSASLENLKRGPGGTMDTEFVVQMLQLKHGQQLPELRVTGTLAGLTALETAGCLKPADADFLRTAYRFQRSIEARIRLMAATGRHEFPQQEKDLAKLAFLLGYDNAQQLASEVRELLSEVRTRFLRIFAAAE